MSQPIDVDLPHNLGKDEARRRIANNIHKLAEHIPGGAHVRAGGSGDQLNIDVQAMGDSRGYRDDRKAVSIECLLDLLACVRSSRVPAPKGSVC